MVNNARSESLFKQKEYHNGRSKQREFSEGEEVWVQREVDAGWTLRVKSRTGELSYIVMVGGLEKRKHADQLRKRKELKREKCCIGLHVFTSYY